MNLSAIEKALGIKYPRKMGTTSTPNYPALRPAPKSSPSKPPISRQDRQTKAIIDAAEERERLWERYLELRKNRLASISREHVGARKFLRTLAKLEADRAAECTGHNDCDVDLAGLASELDLADILSAYDRHTILEEVVAWIYRLAKRRGVTREEYGKLEPIFGSDEPTTVSELKAALKLK